MLSFGISYPDLIKFPYFADTTERGDRGAKPEEIGGETEGHFMDNSDISNKVPTRLVLPQAISAW
jgi:hypothetical protein